MSNLSDFTKGQRVRYIGQHPQRPELTGLTATVVRPVKSRNVVTIEFPDAAGKWSLGWYDAKPENLSIEESANA